MLNLTKKQRGDTIVEVLIAIVVISMVLVAAYVTTTRNVRTTQDTQEHNQALQLAQAQIEFLHNSAVPHIVNQCFLQSSGVLTSGNNCMVDASGTPSTAEPRFRLAISPAPSNPSTTYQVSVTWDSLTSSSSKNNVTVFYQP